MREKIQVINTDENIKALKDFLIKQPNYFQDGVTDCHSIHDVIYFRVLNPKNIMFVGDQFLCDIYAGELYVVELEDKSFYNSIRKQKLKMLPIVKVVGDCGDIFPRYNGYWMIPEQFIKKI